MTPAMKVLVTGAAGFIGYHLARRLAGARGCEVLGVDNLNPYYDPTLKRARLDQLAGFESFRFLNLDFAEADKFAGLVEQFRPDYVAHFGAQAGVRYSLENPAPYVHSNLDGFFSVLEACRRTRIKHLVYASSSSVYGAGAKPPFREDDSTDQPSSFYGATKKCNELMAHSYARSYGLAVTGLRLFTAYGPWGRPDMAPTLFARAICQGLPVPLFNQGKNLRDFTYIEDIVEGTIKTLLYPRPSSAIPARIFNLGHQRSVETVLFVRMLEEMLGRSAQVEFLPPQIGDIVETCADLSRVRAEIGYSPKVPLEEGLRRFVAWFKTYYKVD